MRKFLKLTVVFVFLLCVAVPAMIFTEGSLTGDHSLSYDRSGTWLCWTSHNRMSKECTLLTAFVPVAKLNDIAPNARGYIRCRDGHVEVGNFDVDVGDLASPIFDLSKINCS